jgi:hypothetical protein
MLLVTILCSDPGCEEERELAVDDLDDLEGFACECGHGFVIAAVAELREAGGELVSLASRRGPAPDRRAA